MTGTRANYGVAVPLLLFFGVGGVFFWITMPGIFLGQIWVAVSVLLALVFLGLHRKQAKEERVQRDGIQGTAQILEMTQTGVYVNEQPQVRLRMRVEAPGLTPYELTKNFIVPLIALATLSSGRLRLSIDREDHQNVVVDWNLGGVAADTGAMPMTFQTADGRTVDVTSDPQLQQRVFSILGRHGLATSGMLDLRQHPQARAEVLALLESSGHDMDGDGQAAPATATPTAVTVPGGAQHAAERLEELRRLKEKGLISEAEHESKRIQIISEF